MKTSCDVCKISATDPDPGAVESAVQVLRKGGVIAFPTSGLYGLGADAWNADAVERIFRIKGRPRHKPILLLVKDASELNRIVTRVPPVALRLIKRFWPGGLTLVFGAKDSLPRALTGGSGKIGVRMPLHPVARALVNRLNGPLTGTSANLSGRPGCDNIALLDTAVAAGLDLVLDAGPLKGGAGSTVVDVTAATPVILREGAIAAERILPVIA